MQKILQLLTLGIFLLSAGPVLATDYFVEQKGSSIANLTDEGASVWGSATNINTPCSAETAMERAVAGDTIFFRGGTYELDASSIPYSGESGYKAILQPSNSGTESDPIIFKAYNGETPTLNGHITMRVSGIADTGTDNNHLVDNNVDFVAAGVVNWDILRTVSKAGGAAIDSVTAHEIIFLGGSHNSLDNLSVGDAYEISYRFITTPIGVWRQEYITIDGFDVQSNNGVNAARIIMSNHSVDFNGRGLVVKNCKIYGGDKNIVHGDNREGVRIEKTEGAIVSNCEVYGFNSMANNHNTGAFKTYDNNNLLFENNEVYNSTNGMYIKRRTNGGIIRNNYIHNNYEGVIITSYISAEYSSQRNIFIYNNVIVYSENATISDSVQETSDSDNMSVYNNTFYTGNAKAASISFGPGRKYFYNNILVGQPRDYDMGHLKFNSNNPDNGGVAVRLMASDHNLFNPLSSSSGLRFRTIRYNNSNERVATDYTSLSDWQTSIELDNSTSPGVNSVIAEPLFRDFSGNMNTLDDFHLRADSPCVGAGREGLNIGANIDLVGVNAGVVTTRADVDQNAIINSTDALLTLRNSLGLTMSSTNWQASVTTGDTNCDSNSNSTDALLILRDSLGLDMNGTGWCVS